MASNTVRKTFQIKKTTNEEIKKLAKERGISTRRMALELLRASAAKGAVCGPESVPITRCVWKEDRCVIGVALEESDAWLLDPQFAKQFHALITREIEEQKGNEKQQGFGVEHGF